MIKMEVEIHGIRKKKKRKLLENVYQRNVLPLTNRSHHSSQVGLPLLLVLILRVPDQIRVDGLALVETLQSIQLDMKDKTTQINIVSQINVRVKKLKNGSALCQNACWRKMNGKVLIN